VRNSWGSKKNTNGEVECLFCKKFQSESEVLNGVEEINIEGDSVTMEQAHLQTLLRVQAKRQILWGLAWWSASAIAMYFALESTDSTIFWFGGALGALFHWYRVLKIFEASRIAHLKIFAQADWVLIGVTLIVVIGSFNKIVPEYFRIDTPTIGTCWTNKFSNFYVPVACWSSSATHKTVSLENTAQACRTTSYFKPTSREERFTCIKKL
jgi:hypothetical protein